MITENLSTLKIHKLTQAQYDRELATGNLDPQALYLTPDEEIDLSLYATTDALETTAAGKVDKVEGKGLSTNDYTTEEKTKLDALPDSTQTGQLVTFIEYTEGEIQSLWDSVVV